MVLFSAIYHTDNDHLNVWQVDPFASYQDRIFPLFWTDKEDFGYPGLSRTLQNRRIMFFISDCWVIAVRLVRNFRRHI